MYSEEYMSYRRLLETYYVLLNDIAYSTWIQTEWYFTSSGESSDVIGDL